jgi:hypothetical protein
MHDKFHAPISHDVLVAVQKVENLEDAEGHLECALFLLLCRLPLIGRAHVFLDLILKLISRALPRYLVQLPVVQILIDLISNLLLLIWLGFLLLEDLELFGKDLFDEGCDGGAGDVLDDRAFRP